MATPQKVIVLVLSDEELEVREFQPVHIIYKTLTREK